MSARGPWRYTRTGEVRLPPLLRCTQPLPTVCTPHCNLSCLWSGSALTSGQYPWLAHPLPALAGLEPPLPLPHSLGSRTPPNCDPLPIPSSWEVPLEGEGPLILFLPAEVPWKEASWAPAGALGGPQTKRCRRRARGGLGSAQTPPLAPAPSPCCYPCAPFLPPPLPPPPSSPQKLTSQEVTLGILSLPPVPPSPPSTPPPTRLPLPLSSVALTPKGASEGICHPWNPIWLLDLLLPLLLILILSVSSESDVCGPSTGVRS